MLTDLHDSALGAYLDLPPGGAMAQYAGTIPLGRVQTPQDVAAYVAHLAGPDSDSMTGQAGLIDGGLVMR